MPVRIANPYDTLEVHPRASQEVIDAAFRALMKQFHPDRNKAPAAEATARRLSEAHALISDPARRARYDGVRPDATGTMIGDFRVEAPIAEGGFGKTYLGRHNLVGERVCIKHCSRISPADAAILVEEARAMWDLRHHALPAVRNVIRLDDGSLALVMSYIEGPTLAEVVEAYAKRKEKVDPEDVAWISQRILNALSYIHRHGVVHGDLKPANVIVQPESHTVVLVDFGLAAVRPTKETGSKGYTDLFSPPEQVRGSPLLPQTDLYSLGMTMLYALAGGDAARLERREIPTTVPEPLAQFIRRLLVRDVLARPDWRSEDLLESIERVRTLSFGRANSGMRPLNVK